MRLHIGKHLASKEAARLKKKLRIRKKIAGTVEKPRLCIYRSSKHIYAQLIDDASGTTLVQASTLDTEGLKGSNKTTAAAIGKEVAKRALVKNIKDVVFDRNGYLYHGRVKAFADGAREAGLQF